MKHVAVLYALSLRDKPPTVSRIHDSHRVVFEFDEAGDATDEECCEQCFERFNHPTWNPLTTEIGRLTIEREGLEHTSMTVGDAVCVADNRGARFYLCDRGGWTRIPPGGR